MFIGHHHRQATKTTPTWPHEDELQPRGVRSLTPPTLLLRPSPQAPHGYHGRRRLRSVSSSSPVDIWPGSPPPFRRPKDDDSPCDELLPRGKPVKRPTTPELKPRTEIRCPGRQASFPTAAAAAAADVAHGGVRHRQPRSSQLSMGAAYPALEIPPLPAAESMRNRMRRFIDILLPVPSFSKDGGLYITKQKGQSIKSEGGGGKYYTSKFETRASVYGPFNAEDSRTNDQRSQRRLSQPSSPCLLPDCLLCRDFSAVDAHASSMYPRHYLPLATSATTDPDSTVTCLARGLTRPFATRVDKARAIYTWLAHNISYDIDSYISSSSSSNGRQDRRRSRQSPQETIQRGVAMCGGYAELFAALAHAVGLEVKIIIGIVKLDTFPATLATAISSKQTAPPSPSAMWEAGAGHAWNAVQLDDGTWKVVDSCWGAGYVDDGQYVKKFRSRYFGMSNVEFSVCYFPLNSLKQPAPERFYFPPHIKPPSWEEFMRSDSYHHHLQRNRHNHHQFWS